MTRIMTDEERAVWAEAIPDDGMLNRTDAGNGEHFARLYGDRVRYDHRRKRWLVWAGHWWRDDDRGEVRLLAKKAARDRYQQALGITDLGERKREAGFAIGSENRQRIEAMLAAARSEPPITDPGDRWDADPWLLGVANGVVDLRSGESRAGRPADRITRHVDVPFDPTAMCPRWERFLEEILPATRMSSTSSGGPSATASAATSASSACSPAGRGLERQERLLGAPPGPRGQLRDEHPLLDARARRAPQHPQRPRGARRSAPRDRLGDERGRQAQRGAPQGPHRRRHGLGPLPPWRVLRLRARPQALARGQSQTRRAR